jgi:hypothetical protein
MTIIQFACVEAAENFDHHDNLFNTAGFQSALSRITNSHPMVTAEQARSILLSTDLVEPDGYCHWRIKTPMLNNRKPTP